MDGLGSQHQFPNTRSFLRRARAQIVRLLDAAKRCRLNTHVQVRPESERSLSFSHRTLESYLSGTQGVSPGYDPLAFARFGKRKKRGIKVHAWFNPFRAAANASQPRAVNHISRRYPQFALGTVLWMDQELQKYRKTSLTSSVTSCSATVWVHFDDYFYPYPTGAGHVHLPR